MNGDTNKGNGTKTKSKKKSKLGNEVSKIIVNINVTTIFLFITN